MKILFFDFGSYTYNDVIQAFQAKGHYCKTLYYHFPDKFEDDFFSNRLEQELRQNAYDFVFSVNFFPLVAKACQEAAIPYLSWSYDSPLEDRLAEYFHYDTNSIFLFDRIEADKFRAMGYSNVYHLPLAVNTRRLDSLTFSAKEIAKYRTPLSFVGHLYDNSQLDILLGSSSPRTRGYIEGILQAQLRIYGYYFIEDLLSEELVAAINSDLKITDPTKQLTHTGLSFAIASKITYLERSFLLEELSEHFSMKFYTTKKHSLAGKVTTCGPLKYYTQMPGAFRYSLLNLNPTLKSIQSGIPLRALDIMGAGGVLFSNYQPELAEYCADGQDVIMYTSMEDAVEKAFFYLNQPELLSSIAKNGHDIAEKCFGYEDKIDKMLQISFQSSIIPR